MLMSTLMLFCGSVFAEEVTINFDDDYATLFPTITGVSSNDSNAGDFTGPTTSTAVQGVTVTVTPAEDAKTPSRIWGSSPRLRMYSGTFTVSGTDITKIVFNAPSKFNMSTSTGTLDGKTWTGDKTSEVVFNVGGNTQIKSIVVTLGEGGDTPGPIDPIEVKKAASIEALIGMGDTENVELTLTNAKVTFNDGNSIYVRENGKSVCFYGIDAVKNLFKDNAIVNGTIIVDYVLYQGLMPEVKSNSNTSSKALTVTESEEAAAPVETTLANVAAGNHAADLVTVTANLWREVTETLKEDGTTSTSTSYYLVDGDVTVKAANNNKNLAKLADEGVETIIVTGIVNTYSSAYQIKLTKNAVDPNNPDTPEPPITETDINVAKALEIISGLEDGKTTSETYNVKGYVVGAPDFQRKADGSLYGNVNFTMGDNATATDLLTVYRAKYFGNVAFTEETINSLKEGDEVIVTGKLQKYVKEGVTTPELTSCYFISVNGKTTPDVPEVEPTKVGSIAELLALGATADNLELTLTDAKVLFNDGNNIYVRENGKAVCFYKVDAIKDLFKNNAIINGTIRVDYELQGNLLPEVKANVYTNASTLNVVESEEEAVPVSTTLSSIDEGENAADLVILTATLVRVVKFKTDKDTGEIVKDENGNPVAGNTEYFLDDEEVRVKVANNGKNLGELAEAGETEVSETEKVSTKENVTVIGIVNVYSNAYQIKLTKNAEVAGDGIKGDVNGDGVVDVADISAIITTMATGDNDPAADVNNDGTVDVADISTVITIMAD
jgi:hypothetical protein